LPGVIHIIDSLLVPPFTLTPEKILIGLNATRFVSLLRESGLAGYVNGSVAHEGEAYTILAPVDEPSALAQGGVLLPPSRKEALRNTLAYHVLPGRIRPANLRDGGLLPSELRTPLLKNGRQVVPVEVRRSVLGQLAADAISLGGVDDDGGDWAEIRFAGVQVVGEPVEVGRSIIYRVRSFIDPPPDFVETAVASLDLTTFLAAAFAARLDDRLRAAGAITLLAPDNRAWTRLGLGRDYLLLPEARTKLRAVLRHHVVDEVVYLEDLRAGGPGKRKSYPTLGGGSLAFEAGGNGTIKVGESSSGRQNGELQRARVLRGDAITANGYVRTRALGRPADPLTDTAERGPCSALHVVDQVIIPSSVNVTVGNLLRGAKASVMADLLERAGLDWVLDGRQPTEEDIAELGIVSPPFWSVICTSN
jgi:solute carrier family 25 carnitine/acylcarnitine transporter 20/29